jgi:type VI secretion system protein ImpA
VPAVDAAKLLSPVSATQPCGRDLEYTPELLALQDAAREPDEPGLKDMPVVDTRNWRDVLGRSDKLLQESKNLQVAALLTRALLHVEGLPGFYVGLGVLKGLVDQFWDGLYPPLDPTDADPMERMNAMRALWTNQALNELRASPLVSVRGLGDFSLNDVLVAKGAQKPRAGATPPSPQHVIKGLEQGATPELLAQAREGLENVKALEAGVRAKTGDNFGFDCTPLREVLQRIVLVLNEHVKAPLPAPGQGTMAELLNRTGVADGDATGPSIASVPMPIPGHIQSRDDVVEALEKIVRYYEQHEPSSPVPLLMQRAKRLATMNFMEIMKDLADKGLPQVEAVTGKESK